MYIFSLHPSPYYRPYLSFPNVLEGLFSLANRLFGVDIVPADDDPNMRKWNSDVRAFKVKSAETGADLAFFFLDPYSRPSEKRGGAWMDEVQQFVWNAVVLLSASFSLDYYFS